MIIDSKGGEFGYELFSTLPYAYHKHLKGELTETISGVDTACFYYFSPKHTERYETRQFAVVDHPNFNIHTTKLSPDITFPDLKQFGIQKNGKPYFIIANKYTTEWGGNPVNFLSLEVLEWLFKLLKPYYEIVYDRALPTDCPEDENKTLSFNDKALLDKYKIKTVNDFKGDSYNKRKLKAYASADRFICINGGNSHLAAYMGGTQILYSAVMKNGDGEFNWMNCISGQQLIRVRNYYDLQREILYFLFNDLLKRGINFKYSRYGDGEFMLIENKLSGISKNDKIPYKADMGKELKKCFDEADYFVGVQPVTHRPKEFRDELSAVIYHEASMESRFKDFMQAIKGKNITYIAPARNLPILETLKKWAKSIEFIECSQQEAWEQREYLLKQAQGTKNDIILLSCAMAAKWVIHYLKDKTAIDMGSVFDTYCGIQNRGYQKDVKRKWNLEPIIVNMATHPEREYYMKQAVYSLLSNNTKPDVINICLNNYKEVPSYLKHPLINAFIPEEDQKAKGKFYSWKKSNGFYLLADDDICYPKDYIGYITHQIEKHKRKAVVGFHATTYPEYVEHYVRGVKRRTHFFDASEFYFCNMLGTGTMAFHTDTVPFTEFKQPNMLDPQMAVHLQKNKIPQLVIERAANYITQIAGSQDGFCIWKSYTNDAKEQADILRQVKMYDYKC